MKAIQLRRFGGPDVLECVDLPDPVVGPGEILIRVAACGINFAETLMRADDYVASYALPAIPGSEVAGTVVALGEGVSDFRVGQRVAAVMAAARQLTGGYAELVAVDARVVAAVPDALPAETAVGLLVQGLTALYLMREVSPAGRTVLITAAGGGVGALLVQLARQAGAARVIAAASNAAKRAFAVDIGADRAIGYDQIAGEAPDLVYDSVGAEVLPPCLAALAPHGTVVTFGALNLRSFALGVTDLKRMVFGNQSLRGFAFGPLIDLATIRQDLATLFALAVERRVAVRTTTWPLAAAAAAHAAIAARATLGKLVLVP